MPHDNILLWHLQHNHFPPVSEYWLPACKRAIANAEAGAWFRRVRCPSVLHGWATGHRYHTTWQIISAFHLADFVSEDNDA